MADPTRITFGPGGLSGVGRCRVYTRERWADDWEEEPYLFAEEITWCCAPALPTATLRWDYGRILRADGVSWETVPKLDLTFPRLVKIVVECEFDESVEGWSTRTWHGLLQLAIDQTDGAVVDESGDDPQAVPTGRQVFTAFGLLLLFAKQRPQFTAFIDGSGEQSCDGLRMTFNERGVKNRSPTQDFLGDAYLFWYEPQIGDYWSTKEIVRYLVKYGGPRDSDAIRTIQFRVRSGCYLPDWDRPELPQEGRTTLDLLQTLLHRGRLLNWWLEVVDDDGDEIIELVTQTIVDADLITELPGHHTIPETTRKLHLIYDTDQETQAVVKDSGLPVCDQVVVRGGLVQHVGTFVNFNSAATSETRQFTPGWTYAQATVYDQGASGLAAYAGFDLVEAQRRNAMARARPEMENVYSKLVLRTEWNQKVASKTMTSAFPLFVRYDGGAIQPTPFSALEIQPHLPLFYGTDYSGDSIAEIASEASAEPQNEREYFPPLVLFKRPGADGYVLAQEMGRAADTEAEDETVEPACTVGCHVQPHAKSFRLRVSGKPQHVIGGDYFTPLEEDEAQGVYDWRDMRVTLCLTNGLRIEQRYPDEQPPGVDAVRIHEIEVGEQYEAIYVAPETTVGLQADGTPAYSDGGWIERPVGMRAQLRALAQIAYAWYSQPHYVLQLETARLKGDDVIKLGDLVTRVGDDTDPDNTHQRDVVAPITEIRISWPTSDSETPTAPSMSLTTSAGELDPLQLQAPPPAIEASGVERKGPSRLETPT